MFRERGGEIPEVVTETSLEEAWEVFGKGFLGPEAVENTFGIRIDAKDIPPIPFTREELEKAKQDQFLVLRVDQDAEGKPLTMERMGELWSDKKQKALPDTGWYTDEDFFTKEVPKKRWALVSKHPAGIAMNWDYLVQTELLSSILRNHVFRAQDLPQEYAEAVQELETRIDELRGLMKKNPTQAGKEMANLKINQLTRQTAPEAFYDLLVNSTNMEKHSLQREYAWTNTRTSEGFLVSVGYFGPDGAHVRVDQADGFDPNVGVIFSRTK